MLDVLSLRGLSLRELIGLKCLSHPGESHWTTIEGNCKEFLLAVRGGISLSTVSSKLWHLTIVGVVITGTGKSSSVLQLSLSLTMNTSSSLALFTSPSSIFSSMWSVPIPSSLDSSKGSSDNVSESDLPLLCCCWLVLSNVFPPMLLFVVFNTGVDCLLSTCPDPCGPWSSISDGQSGLLEPHLDGPGLAIELYPDELRLDSDALCSPLGCMENGLRYVIPVEVFDGLTAGEIESLSDSTSLMLQVIVIIGGAPGRSNEVGFSKSFSILLGCFGEGKGKQESLTLLVGGGDPGKTMVGTLDCVGDGVSMINVGITRGGGSMVILISFLHLSASWPIGGGRLCEKN